MQKRLQVWINFERGVRTYESDFIIWGSDVWIGVEIVELASEWVGNLLYGLFYTKLLVCGPDDAQALDPSRCYSSQLTSPRELKMIG